MKYIILVFFVLLSCTNCILDCVHESTADDTSCDVIVLQNVGVESKLPPEKGPTSESNWIHVLGLIIEIFLLFVWFIVNPIEEVFEQLIVEYLYQKYLSKSASKLSVAKNFKIQENRGKKDALRSIRILQRSKEFKASQQLYIYRFFRVNIDRAKKNTKITNRLNIQTSDDIVTLAKQSSRRHSKQAGRAVYKKARQELDSVMAEVKKRESKCKTSDAVVPDNTV